MGELKLSRAGLLAVIRGLLADEIKVLRHLQSHDLDDGQWHAGTRLTDAGSPTAAARTADSLGADSMEMVALAMRVATFFQVHESGLEDYLLRYKTLGEWAELLETARLRGSANITFSTSGSTGTPTQCAQQWPALVAEAGWFQQIIQQQTGEAVQRIIALTPCHHIYGFIFSIVLPELLQAPVLRGRKALSTVQGGGLRSGDVVVGFPFIWRQLGRQGLGFPSGVVGLTSTGPCDAAVIHGLRDQGLEHMIEIYGASETAGLGMRTAPEQPFELLPRWQRPHRSVPLATEQPTQLLDTHTGEHITLNDHLHWDTPTRDTHSLDAHSLDTHTSQRFYPGGRKDNAVQVGGINVYPAAIARQLQSLPGVAQAQVRLMTLSEGERLKAFIVPEGIPEDTHTSASGDIHPTTFGESTSGDTHLMPPGDTHASSGDTASGETASGDTHLTVEPAIAPTRSVPGNRKQELNVLAQELHNWCASHLTTPERPKVFSFGDQLPSNAMNKLSDWDISAYPRG